MQKSKADQPIKRVFPGSSIMPLPLPTIARHWATSQLKWWRLWLTPGRRGERLAVRYLKKNHYHILATNLQCGQHEIDILARSPDGKAMVIVEVKTTINPDPASPPELRANAAKWTMLLKAAHFLTRRYRLENTQIRFDLIGVDLPPDAKPTLRHIPGAYGQGMTGRR